MAPRTQPQPAHGARAETERQALLLAVQTLGVNAQRVQDAEEKQAEAERERAEAAKLLVLLLGGLEDAGVQKQGIARADGCRKGSTVAVAKLLADGGDDMDAEGSEALERRWT